MKALLSFLVLSISLAHANDFLSLSAVLINKANWQKSRLFADSDIELGYEKVKNDGLGEFLSEQTSLLVKPYFGEKPVLTPNLGNLILRSKDWKSLSSSGNILDEQGLGKLKEILTDEAFQKLLDFLEAVGPVNFFSLSLYKPTQGAELLILLKQVSDEESFSLILRANFKK